MTSLFAKSAELTKAYIEAKYSETSADQWHTLMMQAVSVKRSCAQEEWSRREELESGAALNSQLDLISIWKDKADMVARNAYKEKVKLQ